MSNQIETIISTEKVAAAAAALEKATADNDKATTALEKSRADFDKHLATASAGKPIKADEAAKVQSSIQLHEAAVTGSAARLKAATKAQQASSGDVSAALILAEVISEQNLLHDSVTITVSDHSLPDPEDKLIPSLHILQRTPTAVGNVHRGNSHDDQTDLELKYNFIEGLHLPLDLQRIASMQSYVNGEPDSVRATPNGVRGKFVALVPTITTMDKGESLKNLRNVVSNVLDKELFRNGLNGQQQTIRERVAEVVITDSLPTVIDPPKTVDGIVTMTASVTEYIRGDISPESLAARAESAAESLVGQLCALGRITSAKVSTDLAGSRTNATQGNIPAVNGNLQAGIQQIVTTTTNTVEAKFVVTVTAKVQ